jgi:carbon storage regulator
MRLLFSHCRPSFKEDGVPMLVLSRKVGERILIGENISVTVVRITGGGVRIGVEAPPDMAVIRQELKDRLDIEQVSTPPVPLKTAGT